MKLLRQAILVLWILLLPVLAATAAASAEVTVPPERVRAFLVDYLESKKDFLPQARIGFRSLNLPAAFKVPAGKLTCEIIPSDPQILNSRRFSMIFRVDGEVVNNTSVRGELEAIAPVVVAAGELKRGTILSSFDLNMAEVDLTKVRHPCFDAAELVGKKLKRSTDLGEPIDRQEIEFPPLIKRGDLVTITASRGALILTATGVARENGHAGQTISVRNNRSQKDILGKVVNPGAVEVEF